MIGLIKQVKNRKVLIRILFERRSIELNSACLLSQYLNLLLLEWLKREVLPRATDRAVNQVHQVVSVECGYGIIYFLGMR